MTDKRKPEKPAPKIEDLEISKETVQDLTEQQGDQVRGGMVPQTNRNCTVCTEPETTCI
jgi:hypothetical protein